MNNKRVKIKYTCNYPWEEGCHLYHIVEETKLLKMSIPRYFLKTHFAGNNCCPISNVLGYLNHENLQKRENDTKLN